MKPWHKFLGTVISTGLLAVLCISCSPTPKPPVASPMPADLATAIAEDQTAKPVLIRVHKPSGMVFDFPVGNGCWGEIYMSSGEPIRIDADSLGMR
jgi:hypothetical protein